MGTPASLIRVGGDGQRRRGSDGGDPLARAKSHNGKCDFYSIYLSLEPPKKGYIDKKSHIPLCDFASVVLNRVQASWRASASVAVLVVKRTSR